MVNGIFFEDFALVLSQCSGAQEHFSLKALTCCFVKSATFHCSTQWIIDHLLWVDKDGTIIIIFNSTAKVQWTCNFPCAVCNIFTYCLEIEKNYSMILCKN